MNSEQMDRLTQAFLDLAQIAGRRERTKAHLGVVVTATQATLATIPNGYVQVRIDGVGTLALYFGAEPQIGDLVGVLVVENSIPLVIYNQTLGLGTGGWPYDTASLTVDSTDPDADYATIAAAIAAVAADELILFSPETLTCDNQTIIDDAHIAGLDRELSILSTTTTATVLTTGRRNHIFDLSITNEQTDAGDIRGLLIDNIDVQVDNVYILVANAGAGDSYGIEVTANTGARPIFNNVTALADDDGYGLYLADDALPTTIRIVGGLYEGDDAGVFIGNNGTARLFGPIINVIAGTGTLQGLYYNSNADVYLINNDIVLEDNVADALSFLDTGGINYLEFVTTNAQPELVVNQGAADLDTRIEAVGAPNALVVRGGDGNVGIGTNAPSQQLHVYHATDDVLVVFETDKVNGTAQNRFTNDAQSWTLGVNALDRFNIRDVTGAINVLLVYPGAQVSSLVITTTEVIMNDSGGDVDLRWKSDNEPKLLLGDAANDQLRLGDGDTNYFVTDNLGDTWWVGGGGLLVGEIYASDVADTIAIGVAGQANRVQITSFAVNGASNGMTPDHTNDHITILVAGIHLCVVSMAIRSVGGGGADTFGFAVYKNNGTVEFPNLHAHRDLAGGGGDTGSVSLSGIIDLAVSDTIEVWTWNEDSTDDIVIDDITLSLVQIGGT